MRYNIRADEPGSFHHVICRAVDGRAIFLQESDESDFISRMKTLVEESCFRLHAWVLMSNHVHLLIECLNDSLSRSMQRLLGGYAMRFNRSRNRQGHLFQSRFRSILVDEERYFMELVRYIHLNPLRAGMVRSVDDLKRYMPSGHLHIIGQRDYAWQTIDLVRSRFSTHNTDSNWINEYLDFLRDGSQAESDRCEHGSHIISNKGITTLDNPQNDHADRGMIRVVGTESFVRNAYDKLRNKRKVLIRNRHDEHQTLMNLLNRVSELSGFKPEALRRSGGTRKLSRYRRILARLIVEDCGMNYSDAARFMGLSVTMVARYLQEELDPTTLLLEQSIKGSIELK